MSITFTCKRCNSEVKARDGAVGEEMDCPSCGAVLVVPSAGRMSQQEDRPRSAARRRDDEDDDRPARHSRAAAADAPATGVQLGLGIASLALGILAGLFGLIPCLGMFSLAPSSVALALGFIALIVAAVRKWSGLGFPIAGAIVSLLAVGVGVAQVIWVGSTARQLGKDIEQAARAAEESRVLAEKQRKEREDRIEKEKYKPGKPLAKAWENDVAYLSELNEFEVRVDPDYRMGKRGMLGIRPGGNEADREVLVGGRTDAHALSLKPVTGFSTVKYRLNGEAGRLQGEAALNDAKNANERPAKAVTFKIFGDYQPLWESKPMKNPGAKEAFNVDVRGVQMIELQMSYPDVDAQRVFPVWLGARVTRPDKK